MDVRKKINTLDWKLHNWRDLSNGRTYHMSFQKKHCFDDYITIEYFEFLLSVIYPSKKVVLSLGIDRDHHGGKVASYINNR